MKPTLIKRIALITVLFIATACNRNLFVSPTPTPRPTSTLTNTPPPTATSTPTRTPQPTKTPTPMYADSCTVSGSPESFSPESYPVYLLAVDQAMLSQRNQASERTISQFKSYGAATYGSQTTYHALCHDDLSIDETHRSYCAFERVDSTIHVISGKTRGTPETMKNESYLIGKQGWVRQEGGEWVQSWEISDADLASMAEAYTISPFYFSENDTCGTEEDVSGAQRYCFKVNIPKFVMMISAQEVTYVNCVHQNQGILWLDPQTSLPMRLDLSVMAEVTFKGQASDEFPYNVRMDMSEIYQGFNQDFSYPNVK